MIYSLLIFALVAFDQLTKFLIRQSIVLGESSAILPPFLYLTHIKNSGAAFGFLSSFAWGTALLAFISFLASILIGFGLWRARNHWLKTALALLFAGSVGNLIDRVCFAEVTDFISCRFGGWHFPAFNLADSCVVLGSILTFGLLLFRQEIFNDFTLSRIRNGAEDE